MCCLVRNEATLGVLSVNDSKVNQPVVQTATVEPESTAPSIETEPVPEKQQDEQKPPAQEMGSDCVELAERLIAEARNYEMQWQSELAEQCYVKAVAILERKLGDNHVSVLRCGKSLALLYQVQGKDLQAESLYLRLLSRVQEDDELLYPDLIQVLDALAEMYKEQERHQDLQVILLKLLSVKNQSLGSEHQEIAYVLLELADLYESVGNTSKLENCLRSAFATMRATLGPSNERTLSCLKRLAAAQEKLRRQQEHSKANIEWQG